jgi:hypothetical protein
LWFTLETRDKVTALRLVRRKIVVFDSIRWLFKDDSKPAVKAVKWWFEYKETIGARFGWAAVEKFISELADADRYLLEAILSCQSNPERQKALVDENAELRLTISMVITAGVVVEDGDDIAFRDACEKFISTIQYNQMIRLSLRLCLINLQRASLLKWFVHWQK